MTKRVLVCRPQPEAARTAQKLQAAGYATEIVPLLKIHPTGTPCPLPDTAIDAMIVTSRQAVRYIGNLSAKPAYAVGTATGQALAEQGFTSIHTARGTGQALSRAIPHFMAADALAGGAKLVWACAVKPAFDMVHALKQEGIACHCWPVYEARPVANLPAPVEDHLANGAINAVLLTSPRIAQTFAALAPPLPDTVQLLCLSKPIRQALPPALRQQATTAPEPNEPALLSLLTDKPA